MTQDNERSEEMGQRLKEEREYRGFSQEEIAEFLGTTQTKIEEIENGDHDISSDQLEMLADIYQLSVDNLSGQSEIEYPDEQLDLLTRSREDLSENDRDEIRRFAEFLKSRETNGGADD